MNRSPIDMLLILSFLEGRGVTRDYYGRALTRRKIAGHASPAARGRLVRRLEKALKARREQGGELPTVGRFLLDMRGGQSLPRRQISTRLGLSDREYRLLEKDRISPLTIPPECWRRMRVLFNIKTGLLHGMIRHTHELYYFHPWLVVPLVSSCTRGRRVWKSAAIGREPLVEPPGELPELPDEERERVESFLKSI